MSILFIDANDTDSYIAYVPLCTIQHIEDAERAQPSYLQQDSDPYFVARKLGGDVVFRFFNEAVPESILKQIPIIYELQRGNLDLIYEE